MDDIADKTLQALGFHISTTRYLKKRSPHFTDVTDLELNAQPAVVDNLGQVVTNFEKEVMKKKNKYAAKKKKRLAKLYVPIRSFLSSCFESSPLLLPCPLHTLVLVFVFAFIPVLVLASMPVLVFHSGSPVILLTYHIHALISCPESPAILLSCYMPTPARFATLSLSCHTFVSCCKILALLLPLFSILDLSLLFGSSPLRTFK